MTGMRGGVRDGGSRRWTQGGDATDDRATHPNDFARFDLQHGPHTLDVSASPANTKCARYFTAADNGLEQDWSGERVWCNPPYSDIGPWLRKAWSEWPATKGISMLLPASRTEQPWWQLAVEPYRDRSDSPLQSRFLPGRMNFLRPGQSAIGKGERSPFGCVLLVWADPAWRTPRQAVHTWPNVYHPDRVDDGLLADLEP